MNEENKAIGIIGGMGSLATVDLMRKIITMTDAKKDQEHIHILVDCNTGVPDRTSAILHNTETPLHEMARSAIKLEAMGADALLIACNTAHYFYDDLCSFVRIPILNMIAETVCKVKALGCQAVGLLCTDGTLKAGIYEKAFSEAGIITVGTAENGQKALMSLIYDVIKGGGSGEAPKVVKAVIDEMADMKAKGAEIFILGCTELPIAFKMFDIDAIVLDPTAVLARRAVEFAGKHVIDR